MKYCDYFLIIQCKHVFWVLKRTISGRWFFWALTTYILCEKYQNKFLINNLIRRPTSISLYCLGQLNHTQSVTCLATDACLTADSGVASSIPARYHTFVEIDHEIISTVILLPSADLFKKGCCQLQAKVCAQITG